MNATAFLPRNNRNVVFVWGLSYVILVALFVMSVIAVPRVFRHFSRLLPENYRYIATEALVRKDFAAAEAVTRRRLATSHYDFEALYLLGEALSGAGRAREAVDVMQDTLSRARAAGGRNVGASGFQESRTYGNMSRYLWQNREFASSAEMYRAAMDTGSPSLAYLETPGPNLTPDAAAAVAEVFLKTGDKPQFESSLKILQRSTDPINKSRAVLLRSRWLERHEKNRSAAEKLLRSAHEAGIEDPLLYAGLLNFIERNPGSDLATSTSLFQELQGIRRVDPKQFTLPIGARSTTSVLSLGRTGDATARVDTGVFKVTTLLLRIRGSQALGMSPVVVISSGEKELARLYLDGIQPREYALELWPVAAPKSLPLKLAFTNDAFDPVTKSDRNVTVELLGLY